MQHPIRAVYEKGLIRPLDPVNLHENDQICIQIEMNSDFDYEIVEQARREVALLDRIPTLEELHELLRDMPGPTLSELIISEREER